MKRLLSTCLIVILFGVAGSLKAIPLSKVTLKPGQRVAVYTGSFDPFHLAHQRIVSTLLEMGEFDYVFVYAEQDFLPHKPNRSHHLIRHQMIEKIYGDHERVLLSTDVLEEIMGHFHQAGVKIIGVVGSDNASEAIIQKDPAFRLLLKYGGPESWIVNVRPSHKSFSCKSLFGKEVKTIAVENGQISSTQVRKGIKGGTLGMSCLIDHRVLETAQNQGLYGVRN